MAVQFALVLLLLQQAAPDRELFVDPEFRRGFSLTAERHPAPKVEIGVLRFPETTSAGEPAWRVAQWATRYLLEPGVFKPAGEGVWLAETPGKRVRVERPADGPVRLLLEARGATEYGGHMRKGGEAWPHLLIEQSFKTPVRLKEATGLPFALEMRVVSCKAAPWAKGKLDPGLHTAQVSAFWTVHNLNPESADHRDMIWFGIPLFDARHAVPPGHYALDAGKDDASGKFICSLDGKRFWKGNTGDGEWRALDVDLVPLLGEALKITQEHGHMKQTKVEDLAITSFNLGWEIPGPYDAAIELRGVSLRMKDEG